jgi:hypothetical protein
MGIYFIFSSPPTQRHKIPTAQTTHLQTAACLPCKPKFSKELFLSSSLLRGLNNLKKQ